MKKEYGSFTRYNNKVVANADLGEFKTKLESGIYTVHYDSMKGVLWFQDAQILSDEILDLPSKEYDTVINEMKTWLSPEIKQQYNKYNFIYKRSSLLYGLPGTGKTCIVQRVVKDVLKSNGVVLYIDNPTLLPFAFKSLNDVDPDKLTLVVFEEFDRITDRHEEDLLPLLDGEVQKNNIMYLATTNYIDKIPARLKRPGRFSSVIEVKYPTNEARLFYFKHKLKNEKLANRLTEQTQGMSVDELKEVIQAHIILGQDLGFVVDRIKSCRDFTEVKSSKGFDDYVDSTEWSDSN